MGLFDFGRPSGGLLGHVSGAQVPDAMSGINEALLRNAQQMPREPRGGFLGFLGQALGYMGDNLSGNSQFGNNLLRDRLMRQEAEQRQRQRAESLQDFEAKERIKQKYDKPDIPAIAKEIQYWEGIGRPDVARDVLAKHQMTTVSEVDPRTGEVRYRYVNPTQIMGGDSSAVRVSSRAEYESLPPGAQYIAPDGSVRRKGGASPSNGSLTFPGPY